MSGQACTSFRCTFDPRTTGLEDCSREFLGTDSLESGRFFLLYPPTSDLDAYDVVTAVADAARRHCCYKFAPMRAFAGRPPPSVCCRCCNHRGRALVAPRRFARFLRAVRAGDVAGTRPLPAGTRIGRHGRPFVLLKGRTMRLADAPRAGSAITAGADPAHPRRSARGSGAPRWTSYRSSVRDPRATSALAGPRPEPRTTCTGTAGAARSRGDLPRPHRPRVALPGRTRRHPRGRFRRVPSVPTRRRRCRRSWNCRLGET